MHYYSVFGGRLGTDVVFPCSAHTAETSPDWVLRTGNVEEPGSDARLVGSDEVEPGIKVDLFRSPEGYYLRYDDTGWFHVSAPGSEITWSPGHGASLENAWIDVTSRVLAASFHAAGHFTLHASAVAFDGRAIGFLAPKNYGKSTLALALTRAGGRLLTDDTLPILLTLPPTALPGVHAVRLRGDSAREMDLHDTDLIAGDDGKSTLATLPPESIETDGTRLEALYVLCPFPDGGDRPAADRDLLTPVQGALTLITFAKLAPLLGRSERPEVLERATTISEGVPVYHLHMARDYSRLSEVVSQVMLWHVRS